MLVSFAIRTKITIVIVFLLAALTGMGLLAIHRMQAINASAVDIRTNWLPGVRVLGDLRSSVASYRSLIRAHLLAKTAEDKASVQAKLDAGDKLTHDIQKRYEKLIASPQERALYEGWVKEWQSFMTGAAKVLDMSRKSAGGSNDEALDFYNKNVLPLGATSDDFLNKDIALNNVGADKAGEEAEANYDAAFVLVLTILIGAALLGAVVGFALVRDISQAIAAIIRPMQALGAGDLSANVPYQGMKTEIGSMADALQVFKQALIDKRAADQAAAADAEEKIKRGERVNQITRDFEAMIGEIVETVSSASTELEASAGTLTATAERSQQLTATVAAASEEASTNVQSVASATEEMASSVNEISRQVQESASIANQAVDQARNTNARVGELAQAASRIGDVVELINNIAGQTNLLALNATIEAARAGEAGRGFAVVASEVKALAEQTAKATGEISTQISGIQAATQDSVGAIKQIGDTIGRMSEIASTIASAVEEQGAATQEISRNVQQAAHGTVQVSANITDVQHGATETGSASSQVLAAAQSLSSDSTRLKVEVSKFLGAVRAA